MIRVLSVCFLIAIIPLEVKDKNLSSEMDISEKGIEIIKDHEKLRLKGYSIGDGSITIGWGHSEKKNNSKYSIGQKIDSSEAHFLLKKDLETSVNGVRNIFKEWENEKIYVSVNQDQFDCLVSLAYNTGVNKLRRSKLIRYLKQGDYETFGIKIKTYAATKNSLKCRGLEKRRQKESDLFLSYLIDESKLESNI